MKSIRSMSACMNATPPMPQWKDFVVYGCLDEQAAYAHLHGKSVDEAEAMLRDNWLACSEDYLWMGTRAFCYYIEAFMSAALAQPFDMDKGRSFHDICHFRISHATKYELQHLEECASIVAIALDRTAQLMASRHVKYYRRVRMTRDMYRSLLRRVQE